MKKIIYLLIVLLFLCSCSTKETSNNLATSDDSSNTELTLEDLSEEELKKYFVEGFDIDELKEKEKEAEEEQKRISEAQDPVLFDAVEEWNDVEMRDYAIQVDNTLYTCTVTVGELLEKFENSNQPYFYEINPDALMSKRDTKDLRIGRHIDGNYHNWLIIHTYNPFDETTPLSKCPVTFIEVCEDALPYTRFIDGKSYSDLISMTYQEVIDYMKECEKEIQFFSWNEANETSNKRGGKFITIKFGLSDKGYYVEGDGYSFELSRCYEFFIDKDTGKVCDFIIKSAFTY